MAILASSPKSFWHYIPFRSTHVLSQCKGHIPSRHRYFCHSLQDTSWHQLSPANARLVLYKQLLSQSGHHSSSRSRVQFSDPQYAPSVRELLRGLWSLDKEPIWLLVDQLVATGRPHNVADTCPEFPQWQHIVDAPNFFAALSSLVAESHILSPKLNGKDEDRDDSEEDSGDMRRKGIPTWLGMYLVAAKIDTRAAAHASIAFSLSLIESTPTSLRAPLLLIAMCALSEHDLKSQLPIVLQAFQDVFADKNIAFGAQDTLIYQYNIFLTLISKFSLVPQLAAHVDRLLRNMHATGVPLETATAAQLISPRRTAPFLVNTVRHILELQETQSLDALSIPLTRYFSKGRNQWEAAKHIDLAQGVDPFAQARTYLLSFRDVAASLAYLRTIEARRYHTSETQDVSEYDRSTGLAQKGSSAPTSSYQLRRQTESSQTSLAAPPNMRQIYTSMLFAAALSKGISADTFCAMSDSIRIAHGADKVFETVALMGLLRRRAWNKARELWYNWEARSVKLLRTVHRTEAFLERREKTFGDAAAVRETLELTESESHLLRRAAFRMKVDSTALALIVRAVAGSDTAGLLDAFDVMDGYAKKSSPSSSTRVSIDAPGTRFRPHDVRLTSRVLNCFLMCAFTRRRPDIVFRFWDGATQYYGVETSVPTLELLLRSARMAASMEQPLMSVLPRWLLRGTLRDALHPDAFQDFGDEIRWMLSPQCRPGTRWNRMSAWRVARRVFREDIIFANWPQLRDVLVPARPMVGDAATSRFDALQELRISDAEGARAGQYSHLIPRTRTFREYVLLLSRVQRSSEIPQVLAWMRALEVRPSRHMLSLCLALWAEVGIGSPADDAWVKRYDTDGYGEYGKLVTWLEEWLGKDAVPNDAEAIASLKYVRELEQKERNLC